MKFHIITFGCQMNYADSARIRAVLQHCGFSYEEDMSKADIVIFETCSIKQKSEDKITGKLTSVRPDQKIWITGCMIQHNFRSGKLLKDDPKNAKFERGNFIGSLKTQKPNIIGITNQEIEELRSKKINTEMVFVNHAFNPMFCSLQKKWKNLELFWRIDDTGFLPLVLEKIGYNITYEGAFINEYEKILPETNTSMNSHSVTAYVPISSGCNQFCAYCIVPYARGLEKYFPVAQIVDEVKTHLARGVKEIVLLGQIVNKHPQFVEILQEILKLEGLKRLRYTSPYPTYYSPELLSLHEKEEKLCPHIHMPLQSGSDSVLKNMFRGYSVEDARRFVDNIRALKRKISITTDIIVGFSGETEQDFQDTMRLAEYGKFDMIYMGIYSVRPGTLAQKKYTDDVSRDVKRERWNRLNTLLKTISQKNNEEEIGQIYTVLVNDIQETKAFGYTDNMKHISFENKKGIKLGEFVQVKVIQGVSFKLVGECL